MMIKRDMARPTTSQIAQIDVSRYSPDNRRRLSAPGLRTFLAITDVWRLTEEQRRLILGYPSRSTYHGWCRRAREHGTITLGVDTLTRISGVLRIHQSLSALFGSEHEGKAWLYVPHDAPLFGGHPPLNLVTSGTLDGLMLVRRFLDAARGGLYMPPDAADAAFAPYSDSEIVF